MKRIFTILLFLFVLTFSSFIAENLFVEAASKTMYVNAKNDIILREKPSQDAMKLGTIQNHSALIVISTSKGWSYVSTGKTKGYVYTSALSNEKPKVKTIDEITAKAKSRFTTTMNDEKGNEYRVYFLGINDKKRIAGPDDIWAGISEGDILYEGDFQIGIQPKNSKKVLIQSSIMKDYQYNKTRSLVFDVQSKAKPQPDFLFIATVESSSIDSAIIYYIKDGVLKKTVGGLAYAIEPKAIGNNQIQLIDYYNADPFGWEFATYRFNPETGKFTYQGSRFYFNENSAQGGKIVERWIVDLNYTVETPEKRSDYFGDS